MPVFAVGAIGDVVGRPARAQQAPANRVRTKEADAVWNKNIDLIAYHDLDGRTGLKLALQEVAGRYFLYVAGFWHSGWSILDVTDPERPELVRFLDGPANTMTIQVQVADGKMITALEHPPPGLTLGDAQAAPEEGFLIWDVAEPDRPQLLGRWVSGARGTHRNFYNGGRWVYATTTLPGFAAGVGERFILRRRRRPGCGRGGAAATAGAEQRHRGNRDDRGEDGWTAAAHDVRFLSVESGESSQIRGRCRFGLGR
jgi:hypothetical protein